MREPAKPVEQPVTEKSEVLIDNELKWAEDVCPNNGVIAEILADDFQGTTSGGERHTKAAQLRDDRPTLRPPVRIDDARFLILFIPGQDWASFPAVCTPRQSQNPSGRDAIPGLD